MQRGTIKKLVAEKGFGFIAGAAKGKSPVGRWSSTPAMLLPNPELAKVIEKSYPAIEGF